MSDNLSKTVHGDFDAVFCEVTQSCPVDNARRAAPFSFEYS